MDKKINTVLRTRAEIAITQGKTQTIYHRDIEIPTEVLMDVSQIIGDGLAKVSMTMEKSDKQYGNGVGVSVSVTLTCNQDTQSIENAAYQLRLILAEELRVALEDAKSL